MQFYGSDQEQTDGNFLDQPFAEVRVGEWRLSNNTWGVGNLQNGTDYWQTIQYTPGTINGTRFAWEQHENWQGNVRAFPQVIYGTKPWDKGRMNDVTMRLDQMQNLDMTVDLRVERYSGTGNVALDLWLTDKAGAARPPSPPRSCSGWTMTTCSPPAPRSAG